MVQLVYGAAAEFSPRGFTEYILTDAPVQNGSNLIVHYLAPNASIRYIVPQTNAALLDFAVDPKDTVPFSETYEALRQRYLGWKLSELVLHYTNILAKYREVAGHNTPEADFVYRQVQVLEDIFVRDLIELPTIIELLAVVQKLQREGML